MPTETAAIESRGLSRFEKDGITTHNSPYVPDSGRITRKNDIGSVDPDALKIPARRAEYSFQAGAELTPPPEESPNSPPKSPLPLPLPLPPPLPLHANMTLIFTHRLNHFQTSTSEYPILPCYN